MSLFLQRLNTFKMQTLDNIDPDGSLMRRCLRTAVACLLTIVLFQLYGYPNLSAWGGFAAFAFVQNDLIEHSKKRFITLLIVILSFTLLVFAGFILSQHKVLFLLLTPPIIFIGAYIACLGSNYFNFSGWGLFLYILAGSTVTTFQEALIIMVSFGVGGILSLIVCFWVIPVNHEPEIVRIIAQLLNKISWQINEVNHSRKINKITKQINALMIILENDVTQLLKSAMSNRQQESYIDLLKYLSQLIFITHSMIEYRSIKTPIDQGRELVSQAIALTNAANKIQALADYTLINTKLHEMRKILVSLRANAIQSPKADFDILLKYSDYYYHFYLVFELLKLINQHVHFIHGNQHA